MESNKYDYILINKGSNQTNLKIVSKSSFFNNQVVYDIKNECIFLRHASIDDNTKIVTPTLDKKTNFYHFTIAANYEEIEFKKYYFDEDSNEDCVIVCYE